MESSDSVISPPKETQIEVIAIEDEPPGHSEPSTSCGSEDSLDKLDTEGCNDDTDDEFSHPQCLSPQAITATKNHKFGSSLPITEEDPQLKVIQLNAQLDQARLTNRQQVLQIELLTEQLRVLGTECSTLQSSNEQKDRTIEQLKFDIEKSRKIPADFVQDSAGFMEKLRAFQERIGSTNSTFIRRKKEERKELEPLPAHITVEILQQRLEKMQIEVDHILEEKMEIEEEYTRKLHDFNESSAKITEYEAKLMILEDTNKVLQEQNALLEGRIGQLETNVQDLEGELDEVREEVESQAQTEARRASEKEQKEREWLQRESRWLQTEQQLRDRIRELELILQTPPPDSVPADEQDQEEEEDNVSYPFNESSRSMSMTYLATAGRIANAKATNKPEEVVLVMKGVLTKYGVDGERVYGKKHFFSLFTTNINYNQYYPNVQNAVELRWGRCESCFSEYTHGATIRKLLTGAEAVEYLKQVGTRNGELIAESIAEEHVPRVLVAITIDDKFVVLLTKESTSVCETTGLTDKAVAWSNAIDAALQYNDQLVKGDDVFIPEPSLSNKRASISDLSDINRKIIVEPAQPKQPIGPIVEESNGQFTTTTTTTTNTNGPENTFTEPLRANLTKFVRRGRSYHTKYFTLSPSGLIRWGENSSKLKYQEMVKSVLRGVDNNFKADEKTIEKFDTSLFFTVSTTGKQLYLVAPDVDTLNRWIDAIEVCVLRNLNH